MLVLVLFGSILAAGYFYLKYHYSYWDRKNVPNTPAEFGFGSLGNAFRLKSNTTYIFNDLYNKYPNAGLVGYFKMFTPGILVRSPELVKHVLMTDFDHFESNDFDVGDHDQISARNPFMLQGERWKQIRQQITPAFSSGKLKAMAPLMANAANNMSKYISKNLDMCNDKGFDGKDTFSRFTTDNTASCAFGLEANSFDKEKAEFHKMGKEVFPRTLAGITKLLTITFFPTLGNVLKIPFIPLKVTNYFEGIVLETLKYRKSANIARNDFIDSMNQMRIKLGESKFGQIDILAQAVQFFVNGAESSSGAITLIMYNLAKHLDVQKRVQEEIDTVIANHGGEITYEAILEMKYFDQAFNESMRTDPAGFALTKRCTKAYTFPATADNEELTIEAGTPIMISLYGLHRDPKHFPNPDVFDPERFNDENKSSIAKFTYLPFGEGPRACLGQRFGTMQTKMGIATLLKDFDVRLNQNTVQPLQHDPTHFLNVPKDVYFNFHKRN